MNPKQLLKQKWFTLTLEITLIIAATTLSIYLRLLPIQNKGVYLTSDDPIMHYKLTKYLVENGHLPKIDPLAWYPWGQKPIQVFPILHYYLGATLYKIAATLNPTLTVYQFCVYIPAYFSSLAVPICYLITKEIWDKKAAIYTAIYTAVTTGYLQRTFAGYYRHEQFTIPLIMLTLYLTIKAVKTPNTKKTLIYSVTAATLVTITGGLWKGYRYLPAVYALTIYILLLLKKLDTKTEIALTLPILGELIATTIYPHTRITTDTLFSFTAITATATHETIKKHKETLKKTLTPIITGAIIFTALYLTTKTGLETRITFMFTPIRIPVPGSVPHTVAEHGATGAEIITQINIALPLLIPATWKLLQRRKTQDIITLTAITLSFYFTLGLVRVLPLFTTLTATTTGIPLSLTTQKLIEKHRLIKRIHQRQLKKKKAKKRKPKPPYKLLYPTLTLTLLITISLLIPTTISYQMMTSQYLPIGLPPYHAKNTPQGTKTQKQGDWFKITQWIKQNTSKNDVIASWWDYGYWIEVYGERATLADGATTNSSQIKLLAVAFMSDEETAWRIFRRYNVSYVVVDLVRELGFGTGQPLAGIWTAMSLIANVSPREFVSVQQGRFYPSKRAMNTTLFMMGLNPEGMRYFDLAYNTSYWMVEVFRVRSAPKQQVQTPKTAS